MAEQVIDQTATTTADPAAVYALLADGSTWPAWSPIDSFELLEPGDGAPEGLGAVRLFTTGRHQEPRAGGGAHARRGLLLRARGGPAAAGLPGRHHAHALAGGGTTIHWRSTFRAKVPGTGWIYRAPAGRHSSA